MSLPPGWAETTLGEAVMLGGEKAAPASLGSVPFVGLEHIEAQTGSLIGHGRAGDVRSTVVRFGPGDVLFGRLRPYLNKVWLADFSGCASAEVIVLRPRGTVEARFIQELIMADEFLAFTASLDRGDRPRVNTAQISNYRFPLPPLAEQRRIVAKLDALTARLAHARAEAARAVELAHRLRNQVQATGIGHGTILLAELLSAPLRNGLSVKGTDRPPGIPALRLSALRNQSVDLHDVRYLDVETLRAENYRLDYDDVLVSRGNGTLRLVGRASRVAVAPNELTIFPDTAFRIRLDPARASARWFTFIWNSPLVRAQIEARARTTAGIWKISQRDLNEIELPNVAPDDQLAWVEKVEAAFARADRLEAEARKALALIDRLEAAILARAFRGELVPQDPNDEPASVLLERIRARRAAEPRVKRGRRPKLTEAVDA